MKIVYVPGTPPTQFSFITTVTCVTTGTYARNFNIRPTFKKPQHHNMRTRLRWLHMYIQAKYIRIYKNMSRMNMILFF